MTRRLLLCATLALALACGSDDNDDDGSPDAGVVVANNEFRPAILTVRSGSTVRFTWEAGAANHNVLPTGANPAARPESPGAPTLLDAPQSFDVSFTTAGIYNYYCSAHGSVSGSGTLSGMAGRVIVE
ncbi:MAG: plastocyanin/azurin family copper-binding protein [Gemmatimonadales bacterium]|jgi:plastocyanin|nr:plastocyanin/azurin family copper-binding protein [Gemmatimonadales bacterium]